jgi:LAO/AO transport system kinase
MLGLAERPEGAWGPEILKTVASKGEGIDEVVDALERHRRHLADSGELATRRLRRARDEIEAIAVTALREQWRGVHENAALDQLASQVVAGESDPYVAADLLLDSLEQGAASGVRA